METSKPYLVNEKPMSRKDIIMLAEKLNCGYASSYIQMFGGALVVLLDSGCVIEKVRNEIRKV